MAMKVELLKHNIVMEAEHYDERNKIVTIKIFGTMQKFRKDEYKIINMEQNQKR